MATTSVTAPEVVREAARRAQCPPPHGLVVRVVVRDPDGLTVFECLVDFTRHEGRRCIAEVAQWAMPAGLFLTTAKDRRA